MRNLEGLPEETLVSMEILKILEFLGVVAGLMLREGEEPKMKWYRGMVKCLKWHWRSLFCKHHYQLLGHHRMVSENLYGCVKCGIYFVYHTGISTGYKTNKINDKEWMVSLK